MIWNFSDRVKWSEVKVIYRIYLLRLCILAISNTTSSEIRIAFFIQFNFRNTFIVCFESLINILNILSTTKFFFFNNLSFPSGQNIKKCLCKSKYVSNKYKSKPRRIFVFFYLLDTSLNYDKLQSTRVYS